MNINIEANAQELLAMADYMRSLGRLNRAAELDRAAQELQAPPESNRVYFVTNREKVTFGLYGDEGTAYYLRATWDKFGLEVKMYNPCLSAMVDFSDLWKALAKYDKENITPEQFIKVLQDCGFKEND